MNFLDWIVLLGTISTIVLYGTWRTRKTQTIEGYLKGDNSMKWWMIGISIMATQASAITFLSTPGQAIEDGMRFLQFYFGLPLAMVIISVTMVPIYYRLKVFTAYEYLESRFDLIGVNAVSRASPEAAWSGSEVRARIAARTKSAAAAQSVNREVEALYTNGPAGGGGVATSAQQTIAIASVFIDRATVKPVLHWEVVT